jgi:hypothetical protein
MQDRDKQFSPQPKRRLERALIAQTLRDDRADGCPLDGLAAELGEDGPIALRDALTRLERTSVVEIVGESVRASPATKHLDELEMIAL